MCVASICVCVWWKEEGTESKGGGLIERRRIDGLSVCGADPVCLGDIQPSAQFLRGKRLLKVLAVLLKTSHWRNTTAIDIMVQHYVDIILLSWYETIYCLRAQAYQTDTKELAVMKAGCCAASRCTWTHHEDYSRREELKKLKLHTHAIISLMCGKPKVWVV